MQALKGTLPATVIPGLVSVITATHDPLAPFLRETYESLLIQEGVEWEWLGQFDGESWEPPTWLQHNSRVKVECNGDRLGVAITRNRALTRSCGKFIQTLDADDVLLPNALRAASDILKQGDHAYALGYHLDLMPGGQTQGPKIHLPLGEIPPGAIADYWYDFCDPPYWGKMPFGPAYVMWRRDVLFAYGGWSALEVACRPRASWRD